MGEGTRRRVSYAQLEQLWEFLHRNQDLATGFNKTAQSRELSYRMWKEISENLNSHNDGAVKDRKGWCNYWNNYKSKLRKHAAAARLSQQSNGGGQSTVRDMTEVEKKFLRILGLDFGLPGNRVEPLHNESNIDTGEPRSESNLAGVDSSHQPLNLNAPGPSQLQRNSPPTDDRHGSPNLHHIPPNLPPSHTSTETSHQVSARRSPLRGVELCPLNPLPQLLHRRSERSRRKSPMSKERSRRVRMAQTRKQTKIQQEKVQVLKSLLGEFKEFNEITRRLIGDLNDNE